MFSNRSIFLYSFILVFTLVFISCKKTEDVSDTSIVKVRLSNSPINLNPILSGNAVTNDITPSIFMPLIEYSTETLDLVPKLAKSRPQVTEFDEGPYKNGIAYTYEILEDANWDKTHTITAEDYVFTVKSIFNPALETGHKRYLAPYLDSIAIDPDNNKKFTVFCKEIDFRSEVMTGSFEIFPAYRYENQKALKEFTLSQLKDKSILSDSIKMKGLKIAATSFSLPKFLHDPEMINNSGPYKLESWVPKQFIKLVRKKDWWGDKYVKERPQLRAYPQEIIYIPIPEDASALAALQRGDVDILPKVNLEDFFRLKADKEAQSKFHFLTPKQSKYTMIPFNMNDPILKDVKVRKALAYIINVDGLIEKYTFGNARRMIGPVLPTKSYYNDKLPLLNQDLNLAKSELESAGWTDTDGDGIRDKIINGIKTKLSLKILIKQGSKTAENYGINYKSDALKVGVELVLDPVKSIIKGYKKGNYQLSFIAPRGLPGLDALTAWRSQYSYMGFGNEETDKMIDEINLTKDAERRNELYLQLQEMIYNEYPAIFLYVKDGTIIVSKKFKDTPESLLRPGYVPQYFR